VIEAIAEDRGAKQQLFEELGALVGSDAILASNTSSLSITALAARLQRPERLVGMHFFNPAPRMALVEVVRGLSSAPETVAIAIATAEAWGKTAVEVRSTPGFVVNRVARPFYGEALRALAEGAADVATIDALMRAAGGFRMGPFELMDLIGNDVNYAVTASVFEGMFYDPRYRPSLIQRRLVDAGLLGRKRERGYYDYRAGAPVPEPLRDAGLAARIIRRILAMLVNEAVEAVRLHVAAPHDIELAMTKGVNYPRGLLAWGDQIGPATVLHTLEALQAEYGDDRYRPSPLLKTRVRDGAPLLG
jgi:3-hydroxybutyryl-CoA dehydrogenase